MKFSEKWLRTWVDPPISTHELLARLTGAGLEVDSAEPVAPALPGVVVGHVLSVSSHPNADKLTLCRVDIGEGAPLGVVCGASNVREGLRAPLATIGARLADGGRIKPSKIRGQESAGMLCSARELGLAESVDGLMELPADASVGKNLSDYLDLEDTSIEIDLTPNRGDCLSIAGIAREVGVLSRAKVSPPAIPETGAAIPDEFPVKLESPADCPRYVGRVIRNIDPGARTPVWMQERLRRSGVRAIGPVVDVTNYVMLELGQPMHAFDLDTLDDTIRVRHANQGETLALLNGTGITLHPDTLVIADAHRPVALAGVMGGEKTAVTDATLHIFLESAFFTPKALAGQARRHGLHTDSSHRFERGVDPGLQRIAAERATALLMEIAGGEPGPVIEVVSDSHIPRPAMVRLRGNRLRRLLGTSFEADTVSDVLARLGMTPAPHDQNTEDEWRVTPPGFRFDIALEADLIEEVARVTGYENIPAGRPILPLASNRTGEAAVSLARMRRLLVERDYREAITYSFVEPDIAALMDPGGQPLALQNPISSEMAVMRTTLLPGLAQAVTHNMRRQRSRVRLFESGLVFERQGGEIIQKQVLGAIATGGAFAEQWGVPDREVDFFDVKSDVEALLSLTGPVEEYRFVRPGDTNAGPGALHPGQSASIERAGQPVGWIGNLHPRIGRELKLGGNTLVFQIELASFGSGTLPTYAPLSKFPIVRRDIAVIVDNDVSCRAVEACIQEGVPHILKSLILFDEYRGEGVGDGRKSLAFGLLFQDISRTLRDSEIDGLVTDVMAMLKNRLGAMGRV